jgi:hypothetical protein
MLVARGEVLRVGAPNEFLTVQGRTEESFTAEFGIQTSPSNVVRVHLLAVNILTVIPRSQHWVLELAVKLLIEARDMGIACAFHSGR